MAGRPKSGTTLPSATLVGGALIVFAVVATILSYNANRGLPFVPTYDVKVAVPDASELIPGSSEVRIGGSRVGIVKAVDAVPAQGRRRAYALLSVGLDKREEGLPADTSAEVRPRSILGAKYLELTRGTSRRELDAGGTLPLAQATQGVAIDEAFKVFEPRTRTALQQSVTNLGDALAGRGAALNQTIPALTRLLPPLQRTLRTLAAPGTGLGRAISAADGATAALAPVAPQLAAILDDGATTLAALDAARPELDRTLADTPGTLEAATRAGRAARPGAARRRGAGPRAAPRDGGAPARRPGAAAHARRPAPRSCAGSPSSPAAWTPRSPPSARWPGTPRRARRSSASGPRWPARRRP